MAFRRSRRLLVIILVIAAVVFVAGRVFGQTFELPLKASDGSPIANHTVPPDLESRIAELPGVVVVGNPEGDVTIAEFYDLNCAFCRRAAQDVSALLAADKNVRLMLVPFPVLGIPSIQASRVELAVGRAGTPAQFLDFHRKIFAGRGTVDGKRALAVAKELGLAVDRITKVADDDAITETMLAHVRLGDALGLQATPSYVVKGVAVLGHPGRDTLERIVASARRCGKVMC